MGKTPLGSPILKVEFVDGSSQIVPKPLYDRLVSLEARDATNLRQVQVAVIADLCYPILQEYALRYADFPYFGALLKTTVEKHLEAAHYIKWGKSEGEVTLFDIKQVTNENQAVLDSVMSGGDGSPIGDGPVDGR